MKGERASDEFFDPTGSFFFKKSRLAPRPNPASADHLAAAIYCFCSCFFPNHKVGNPTHALCIGKAARNGGGDVASPLPPYAC